MEGILHALSDPMRVAIYAAIAGSSGAQTCSSYLRVNEQDIPKSTLSQHFRILREAGLIRGERRGIEMHNVSRCAELEKRFPGLVASIINAHKLQLAGRQSAARRRKR